MPRATPSTDNDETSYRKAAAGLFAVAVAISTAHRLRARAVGGAVSLAAEGAAPAAVLRAAGLALWLAVGTWLLRPRAMRRASLPLPPRLRWLGAITAAANLPLIWWLFRAIGTNITPTVATRPRHRLVTTGPYRWVRHPLYSVGFCFFLSLGLLAANWAIAALALAVLVLLLRRLPKEEAELLARFGEEYRAYASRTGRLLPRLPLRPD